MIAARPSGPLVVAGATGWLGGTVVAVARERGLDVRPLHRDEPVEGLLSAPGTVLLIATGAGDKSDPGQLHQAHVAVPQRLARAALDQGAAVLALGSAAEYGVPQRPTVGEDHPELPVGAYGSSKLEGTLALRALAEQGLLLTVARVFNVLGPGRRDGDPVQDFARAVQALPDAGGTVEAWDSTLERDVAPVTWVGERLVDLAGVVGAEPTVNVCTGHATRFRDLIEAMGRVRGVPLQVRDVRPGGLPRVVGDPGLLHRLVGTPPVPHLDELAELALRASAEPGTPEEPAASQS